MVGIIRVFGGDFWVNEKVRVKFGVFFDFFVLLKYRMGCEWFEFLVGIWGSLLLDIVEVFFLMGFFNRRILIYLVGMVKCLSIVFVFVGIFELILLDEFFVNFDFDVIFEIVSLLRCFVFEGILMVIVFYVWKFFVGFVDRVVVMVGGRVKFYGEIEEVVFVFNFV